MPDTENRIGSFLEEVRSVVGEPHVLTEPDVTASYTTDWMRRWSGTAAAVVRPGSTEEVAGLVHAARRHRIALVPQGGNTGLVGGSVPHVGEVVVSMRRLDRVERVDQLAAQVTVGAGATLEVLQEHAARAGLAFGVDLGSRGSATIGGMIATNAGGLHVIRHGSMRAQVVGLEAVLGTGEVVSRLSGLVKDNTGYDLAQLLCGSEGTLGIVTWARLRLVPEPRQLVVALLALRSLPQAVELAAGLRRNLDGVRALELMEGSSVRRVLQHSGLAAPVRIDDQVGAVLLVEADGAALDPTEALASAISAETSITPLDSAVATSEADRRRLWHLRERHSETPVALASQWGSTVHKLDVTLPAGALAEFCDQVAGLVEQGWPGSAVFLFGHVGDGNVHVNVVEPRPARISGTGSPDPDEVDDAVFGLVVARGGSISAEHGIGVAKKRWLASNRSPGDVAAMRAVKAALDPDDVLNPHVLFEQS